MTSVMDRPDADAAEPYDHPSPTLGRIDAIELPEHGAPGEHRLAPVALRYANIRSATAGAVVAAVAVAATLLLVPDPWWRTTLLISVGVLTLVLTAADVLVLNAIETRSTSYTATADYVRIARGRWLRRSVVIATSQILNVEIVQGPVLRALGAVKVRLTCISEGEEIAPLLPGAARALQHTVLEAQRDPGIALEHDRPERNGDA